MPKTLAYAEVEAAFRERGFSLLSTEYVNSKTKLSYRCPSGHVGEITWNDFSRDRGCPVCWTVRKRQLKLTPIEQVRESFEKRGYSLLSTFYTDGKQRLEAICSRGHAYSTRLPKWNRGDGCAKCANIENSGPNNPNWNPNREAVAHNKKVWTAWRNMLRAGASGRNKRSSDEVKAILGYDWTELREHLQKHPNWEQCKDNYHVDHIFPIKAFTDYGIKDPQVICALSNIQPLPAASNWSKNRFYDAAAFEQYLSTNGIKRKLA